MSHETHVLSDSVRTLSISDVKEQPLNYMDPEIQNLVNGFIKAKQDAVRGKPPLDTARSLSRQVKAGLATHFLFCDNAIVEDFPSAKRFKSGYEEMIMVSLGSFYSPLASSQMHALSALYFSFMYSRKRSLRFIFLDS